MEMISEWPVWTSLVTSLLHSLWQGAAVSLVLFFVFKFLPAKRSRLRYVSACGALLLLVVLWLGTWSWLEQSPEPIPAEAISLANPARITESVWHSSETALISQAGRETPRERTGASTKYLPEYSWSGWAAALWLAGVIIFQLRLIGSLTSARGLIKESRPIVDPSILATFSGLLERFGLGGQVALRESANLSVPAVWGWMKPLILVPPSFFTKIPPDQIEAILAHELAHIRRHDFAVNLLQKAIEGVLFFNPFVWWISRQMRNEREACCDAEAVRFSGQPGLYARALAEMAIRTSAHHAPPEPVLSVGRSPRDLFYRVKRVLDPAGYPPLQVSFRSAGGLLLLCLFGMLLVKITATTAIAVLSPAEERMERFTELRATYQEERSTTGPIEIHGQVRTAEGEPLPEDIEILIHIDSEYSTGAYASRVNDEGAFLHRADATLGKIRAIYVTALAPGYAPVRVGPMKGPFASEGAELELSKGHDATISFRDPAGRPVPNVTLSQSLYYQFQNGGASPLVGEATSDEEGLLLLENIGDLPFNLETESMGFEPGKRTDVHLDPGEVFEWVLEPTPALRGTAVFEDTGEPAPEARIFLARTGPASHLYGRPRDGTLLAQADSDGRFELTTLNASFVYHFIVVANGASSILAGPVRVGDGDLRLELPRARHLQVRVVNVTEEDLDKRGRLLLHYKPTLDFGQTMDRLMVNFDAVPQNGQADFDVGPLWAVEGKVAVGDWEMPVDGRQDDEDTDVIVVDLRAEAQRRAEAEHPWERPMEITFTVPSDAPAAGGALVIEQTRSGRKAQILNVDLVDGQARLALSGTGDKPASVEFRPEQLVGYWFPPQRIQVPSDESLFTKEIAVVPAGAIHGDLMGANGEPTGNAQLSVLVVDSVPGVGFNSGIEVKESEVSSEGNRRFLAGPLPLEGTYFIYAERGFTYAFSDPITLTEAEPFREIALTVPPGEDISVTVLRPDGTPFADEPLSYRYKPIPNRSFGKGNLLPDRKGRLVIPGINPDAPGHHELVLPVRKDYRPVVQPVIPGRMEVIELREGLVLEGRLIDANNGNPVPGREVYAVPKEPDAYKEWSQKFEAEGPSDSDGAFRFSNLPPGEFIITAHNRFHITPADKENQGTAGSGQPVIVRLGGAAPR